MPLEIINASCWAARSGFLASGMQYSSTPHGLPCADIEHALNISSWKANFRPFAELVVDFAREEVVMVRDHHGCEPFYYFFNGAVLVFGSCLPDLLKQLPKASSFNTTQLLALFTQSQIYTDETFHQHIYRVEPGCMLHIKKGEIKKRHFWCLDTSREDVIYSNEEEYIDRFSELFQESLQASTGNPADMAVEFSGGLDSSALVVGTSQQGQHYPLFMHVNDQHLEERQAGEGLLRHLGLHTLHYVKAENFDPLTVLQHCAACFAGPAPYLFFMLAHNVHQAVVHKGCKILLSGFGGDQCVSGHAFLSGFLPETLGKKGFRQAWQELIYDFEIRGLPLPSAVRRAGHLLKMWNPGIMRLLSHLENSLAAIRHYWLNREKNYFPNRGYRTVREQEWDMLQGPQSHELRMRIEYSAVIAKTMGFEYRYPLLHPGLLEFCFQLPFCQKRQKGVGRLLIRRWLERYLPPFVHDKPKMAGIITPATLDKCQEYLRQGLLPAVAPPCQAKVSRNAHDQFICTIHAYMLQWIENNPGSLKFSS